MKPNRQWVMCAVTILLAQGCQEDAPPLPITVSGTASPGGFLSSPEPYLLPFSVDAPGMIYINMQDDFISTPNRWNVTLRRADYERDVSGSFFEMVSLPDAGNYEFVINCRNSFDTCRFTATLSSTPPLVYDPDQEIANDGVYEAPFALSEPATVRYWLDDNFVLTQNGWRVAIVATSDVDAFVGGAAPTAYGSFEGMGPTNAVVELPVGDYTLVVACTNTVDPCRFDTAVVVE